MTTDISRRLDEHNVGKTTSTRKRGPWKLIYSETCNGKEIAWKRERQIKKYKGGDAFKKLIHGEVA